MKAPKPVSVIKFEKKSHRTKKELKLREEAEKSLLTGQEIKEESRTKENDSAHKEFLRVKRLLKAIEKNDELYAAVINRYCQLKAEIIELKELEEMSRGLLAEVKGIMKEIPTLEEKERINALRNVSKTIHDTIKALGYIDGSVTTKRKMLLEIEKENVMTIASSLRSVPKREEKASNSLMEILRSG